MRKVRGEEGAPGAVEFRCTLDLPPSVNDWLVPMLVPIEPGASADGQIRARMAVRGADGKIWAARMVKSKDAKKWLDAAQARLKLLPRPAELHRGVLELEARVFVPTVASDGNNRLKLQEDAFNEIVWDDDRQLVKWTIVKDIDAEHPRVEVRVRQANPAEHPRVAERLARAEKEREKKESKVKAEKNQGTLPLAAWKTSLPAGSSAGTQSYGSKHASEFGLKPGSSRQLVRNLREGKVKLSSAHRPPDSNRSPR